MLMQTVEISLFCFDVKVKCRNFHEVCVVQGAVICLIQMDRQLVCVEDLRPSQPNGVMSSMFFLPNHTFTGQT